MMAGEAHEAGVAGELRARHGVLSATQVRFLDFAAREPACRQPESFGALAADDFMELHLQPWPVFLGPAKRAEAACASIEVCALIKDIPQRVFGNDPEKMAEYYDLHLDITLVISTQAEKAGGLAYAVARGDFIETAAGFKCCEFNIAGNLGGWEAASILDMYLSVPVLRRFLDEQGIAVTAVNPVRVMFSHLVDDALARSLASGGQLNLAILLADGKEPVPGWQRFMDCHYRAALAERAGELNGTASVCAPAALTMGDGGLLLGDRRIHLVIDTGDGETLTSPMFFALIANQVRLYNGPASLVLSHKLNLALLSELQDSDLYSAEERATIRAHVPWSRRVTEDFVDYGGERVYLPDLLDGERDKLVLKRGIGMQGSDVHSGRFLPSARWQEVARAALAERGWLVQERLDPVQYLFQLPGGGAGLHDSVWGMFVFGRRFGGSFLRVLPSGRDGVINHARGAKWAGIFEVEE